MNPPKQLRCPLLQTIDISWRSIPRFTNIPLQSFVAVSSKITFSKDYLNTPSSYKLYVLMPIFVIPLRSAFAFLTLIRAIYMPFDFLHYPFTKITHLDQILDLIFQLTTFIGVMPGGLMIFTIFFLIFAVPRRQGCWFSEKSFVF